MLKIDTSIDDVIKNNSGQEISDQELLVFSVGKNEYAIRPVKAQGLYGYESVIPVSDAPDILGGIINACGCIAPVIDMRLQFEADLHKNSPTPNVLMLKISGHVVGLVVNRVAGVIECKADQVEAASPWATANESDYWMGILTLEQRMIHIIDIDRIASQISKCLAKQKAAFT